MKRGMEPFLVLNRTISSKSAATKTHMKCPINVLSSVKKVYCALQFSPFISNSSEPSFFIYSL